MKVVVGLGNPGKKYERTRHNVGFRVIDKLARAKHIKLTRHRLKFYRGKTKLAGETVLLVKPLTYMNNSGVMVRQVVNNINLADLLIVSDDFQLPLGKIRIRRKGSSGSHKGLESIIQHLGTNAFPRLRIGIGGPAIQDPVKYVLGNFTRPEEKQISSVFNQAVEAIKIWVRLGINECMNRFN